MTKKKNIKKTKTDNKGNYNKTNDVDSTDTDTVDKINTTISKITKISINLFIETETPFFEDVLERINKIKKHNYEIQFNIFSGIAKYNKKYFIEHLDNFKECLVFPNNYTKINKIMFDDIEFKFDNVNISHATIDKGFIKNIIMSKIMYNRLYPLIEDEDEIQLDIYTEDDIKYTLQPDKYTNPNFLINGTPSDEIDSTTINLNDQKKTSIQEAIKEKYDYYVYLDNYAFLIDNNILHNLIRKKKNIIGPKLTMAGGQPNANVTFHEKNKKYMVPILQDRLKNIWEVEKINNCYLINLNNVNQEKINNIFDDCKDVGKMYCHNLDQIGWIINNEVRADDREHPELYQFQANRMIWHRIYMDPVFYEFMEKNKKIEYREPKECRDIFEWDCFTEKFCKHLIDECEKYGQWSTGGNKDSRLSSGYENVPTRDIHLKQIGLGEMWKEFVVNYFGKIAGDTFSKINTRGYNIAFVVRYTMDTQKELKPHHDASVHSTVTCLNNDFTGGGTHFLRQNYTHNPKQIGVTSIHPGRCTHYHSGKAITGGTRYILISFNE
jgi:hypothetical protein